jgi:hypothetical protein
MIVWDKSMLISNLNESDAINKFQIRKADLQEVADKLWPKFSAILLGEKDVALPYLLNPDIFHGHMPYYAELVS